MDQCVRLPKQNTWSLLSQSSRQNPADYVSIVDMGLIWGLATPTFLDYEARKWDGSDYGWSDYLGKICSLILFSSHTNAYLFILMNDKYDLPYSIKMMNIIEWQQHIFISQMFFQSRKASSHQEVTFENWHSILATKLDYRRSWKRCSLQKLGVCKLLLCTVRVTCKPTISVETLD